MSHVTMRPRRAGTGVERHHCGESTVWGGVMRKIVRCMCGIELSSEDEVDLIAQVAVHAKEAHDLDLDEEQIRAMMEIDQ